MCKRPLSSEQNIVAAQNSSVAHCNNGLHDSFLSSHAASSHLPPWLAELLWQLLLAGQ